MIRSHNYVSTFAVRLLISGIWEHRRQLSQLSTSRIDFCYGKGRYKQILSIIQKKGEY